MDSRGLSCSGGVGGVGGEGADGGVGGSSDKFVELKASHERETQRPLTNPAQTAVKALGIQLDGLLYLLCRGEHG